MHEQEGSSTSTRHSDTSVFFYPSKEIGCKRVTFGIRGGWGEGGSRGTYELAINVGLAFDSLITMLGARARASLAASSRREKAARVPRTRNLLRRVSLHTKSRASTESKRVREENQENRFEYLLVLQVRATCIFIYTYILVVVDHDVA